MLFVNIEVVVSTSISPLRTCIKVLPKHIVYYTERYYFELYF